MTGPYARSPLASNLIAFSARDSTQWASLSWRDSGAGYANGRFAMDVNAIWAPAALVSVQHILRALKELGLLATVTAASTSDSVAAPLSAFIRDSLLLDTAIARWRS